MRPFFSLDQIEPVADLEYWKRVAPCYNPTLDCGICKFQDGHTCMPGPGGKMTPGPDAPSK